MKRSEPESLRPSKPRSPALLPEDIEPPPEG
jgi:hypothetical protein